MADALPTEDFSMNYEEIKIDYSRSVAPPSADTFDFTTAPKSGETAGWAEFWHDIKEFIAERRKDEEPVLTDEMPEDLPAGLVVDVDFDFIL